MRRAPIAPIPSGCDAHRVSDGEKKPGGATGKGFKPGQSGNPGGRPKGYERRLRECVDAMKADDPMSDPEAPDVKIPAFEAICKRAVLDAVAGDRYARDFIADRLMGKPKMNVAITDETGTDDDSDLDGLTTDELRVLAKVRAQQATAPGNDDVH